MGMTLATPIAAARLLLSDADAAGYRISEPDILAMANDALDALAPLLPGLFQEHATFTCVAGARQRLNPDEALALVRVVRRSGDGEAVALIDQATLDAFAPGWMAAAAAPAEEWMPDGADPLAFYLNPPATNAQQIEVLQVAVPQEFAADDDTGLPMTLSAVVADYIVGMASAIDDDHINEGRAALFMQSWKARVGKAPPAPKPE